MKDSHSLRLPVSSDGWRKSWRDQYPKTKPKFAAPEHSASELEGCPDRHPVNANDVEQRTTQEVKAEIHPELTLSLFILNRMRERHRHRNTEFRGSIVIGTSKLPCRWCIGYIRFLNCHLALQSEVKITLTQDHTDDFDDRSIYDYERQCSVLYSCSIAGKNDTVRSGPWILPRPPKNLEAASEDFLDHVRREVQLLIWKSEQPSWPKLNFSPGECSEYAFITRKKDEIDKDGKDDCATNNSDTADGESASSSSTVDEAGAIERTLPQYRSER